MLTNSFPSTLVVFPLLLQMQTPFIISVWQILITSCYHLCHGLYVSWSVTYGYLLWLKWTYYHNNFYWQTKSLSARVCASEKESKYQLQKALVAEQVCCCCLPDSSCNSSFYSAFIFCSMGISSRCRASGFSYNFWHEPTRYVCTCQGGAVMLIIL